MSKSFVKRSMETVGMDGVGSVFAVGTAGVGDGPRYIIGGIIDDIRVCWDAGNTSGAFAFEIGGLRRDGADIRTWGPVDICSRSGDLPGTAMDDTKGAGGVYG